MAVDDPGGGREQCGVAVKRRLQCARGFTGQRLHVEHAIGFGMRPDRLQLFGLVGRRCHDQLAAVLVGNAVLAAVMVQGLFAADAHPRHQASGGIVDAGVDHLAVARRGDGADALSRFQHDHLAAGLGQPARDRKADDASTNNDALNLVHGQLGVRDLARRSGSAALGYGCSVNESLRTTHCFASNYLPNRFALAKH